MVIPVILTFLMYIFPVPLQAQESELTYLTYTMGSDVIELKPMEGASQIYEFVINQQVVMRYRTMQQGLSAQERALIIFERAKRLGKTLKEGTVVVENIKGSFAVKIEGKLFITVTEADFRANNSTGEGLANIWAQNLIKARTKQKQLQTPTTQTKPESEVTQLQVKEPQAPSSEVPVPEEPVHEVPLPETSDPEAPSQDIAKPEQLEHEVPRGKSNASSNHPQDTITNEPTVGDAVADNAIAVTAEELKMLELVNQERAKAAVAPLILEFDLVKIARLKAQDMIDKEYFNHTSPTYGDPFTMMKKFGIQYGYAGENLAGNPSVENAHVSLMASPGHKKNILSPNYTHIGIGIVDGGSYGKMLTQLFISKN